MRTNLLKYSQLTQFKSHLWISIFEIIISIWKPDKHKTKGIFNIHRNQYSSNMTHIGWLKWMLRVARHKSKSNPIKRNVSFVLNLIWLDLWQQKARTRYINWLIGCDWRAVAPVHCLCLQEILSAFIKEYLLFNNGHYKFNDFELCTLNLYWFSSLSGWFCGQ